ncbi:MAG: hypothetical protein SFY66_13660 [Oculatellaceae cyanobacterium bins.114]|nr:hypothetical protein [Oculatellaceae cyanobacterium bins.114]
MFALVSPEKIQLPPGSVVRLPATWDEYQALNSHRSLHPIGVRSQHEYCHS